MADNEHIMKTGTTTVGIVCKDGIVLAADMRATAGNLIVQKETQKIAKVNDNIAVTMAGTASDGQMIIRLLRSELKIRAIRSDIESSVPEAANLMSRMVYSNIRKMSMIPSISHFIMGGADESGFYLYDIFPDGTLSECPDYISSGSGSVMAYGVLESSYRKDMSLDEGINMAYACVNAAVARDSASGNGMVVYTITNDGANKVETREIPQKAER